MVINEYLYILKFFTFWSVMMVVFHHMTSKHINLLYITFVTAVIGLYLSFVKPRKFVFYFERVRYEYTGIQKFIIVDMIFHLLALYFIYTRYRTSYTSITDTRNLTSLLIFIIYLSITNTKKVYGVEIIEMIGVFICATVLYWLIFHRK